MYSLVINLVYSSRLHQESQSAVVELFKLWRASSLFDSAVLAFYALEALWARVLLFFLYFSGLHGLVARCLWLQAFMPVWSSHQPSFVLPWQCVLLQALSLSQSSLPFYRSNMKEGKGNFSVKCFIKRLRLVSLTDYFLYFSLLSFV